MSINLPILKIISLTDLFLHEEPDPVRSEQLADTLLHQGILRNPPIVLPTNTNKKRYMVLDGANRITAFKKLGYPHIIVQVTPNDGSAIRLSTWNHLVWGQPVDLLFSCIKTVSQSRSELVTRNRKQITNNDPKSIQIQFADGNSYSIGMLPDISAQLEQIRLVTSCYKGKMHYTRTGAYDITKFKKIYDPLTAVIVYPLFKLPFILELAENELCLPSGITHFLINERCLHLNYPIDELTNSSPASTKNERLKQWLEERIRNRKIRHYSESTILFDD